MHFDDVWMPQLGSRIRFSAEPLHELGIGADVGPQHLDCILAGQSGMLGEVDLAHAPRAE